MNPTNEWFCSIYSKHFPKMVRTLYQAIGDGEMAEDLVQEAFVSLFLKQEKVRQDYPSVVPWLWQTVKFRFKNEMRRSKYKWEVPFPEDFEPVARDVGDNPRHSLPPGLSEEEQELLLLTAHGYMAVDIARVKGITPSACRMRLKRARDHCLSLLLEKK